jgi:hypothetical protein
MDENLSLLAEDALHVVHESLLVIISELIVTPILTAVFVLLFLQVWRRIRRHAVRSENKKISFTVNAVENGLFTIRTIADELAIDEEFLDPVLRHHIKTAWKKTRRDDPIMEFPWSDDEEDDEENGIMSTFQGRVSAQYVTAHMMAAAGLPVDKKEYIFMVTYEHYGLEEVRKIRVIFAEQEFLLHGLPKVEDIRFEKPHQKTRIRTLELMRERYLKMDENRRKKHWIQLPSPTHCMHFRAMQNPATAC